MHHNFHEYAANRGDVPSRQNGVMVSMSGGNVNAYSSTTCRSAARCSSAPATRSTRTGGRRKRARQRHGGKPTTAKKLSNMRTTSSDENIILKRQEMTLEQGLEYIEEDELVEVTPASIRIRKVYLTENERKRAGRKAAETVEV